MTNPDYGPVRVVMDRVCSGCGIDNLQTDVCEWVKYPDDILDTPTMHSFPVRVIAYERDVLVDCDWCVVAHVEHPNSPCPRCPDEHPGKVVKPCERCAGAGYVTEDDPHGENRTPTCDRCGGTGVETQRIERERVINITLISFEYANKHYRAMPYCEVSFQERQMAVAILEAGLL